MARCIEDHGPDRPKSALWVCFCGGINAWNYEDAERASRALREEVKVSHGSCFDNVCGHCGADVVAVDSPIRANCYTHEED